MFWTAHLTFVTRRTVPHMHEGPRTLALYFKWHAPYNSPLCPAPTPIVCSRTVQDPMQLGECNILWDYNMHSSMMKGDSNFIVHTLPAVRLRILPWGFTVYSAVQTELFTLPFTQRAPRKSWKVQNLCQQRCTIEALIPGYHKLFHGRDARVLKISHLQNSNCINMADTQNTVRIWLM